LLRDYVLILANSGIRHGTEADNLCWRHIRFARERGRDVLLFYVDGKTGGREIVARNNCATFLSRIQSRNPALNGMTLKQLLESKNDSPVFTLSDGSRTDNLRGTFRIFLKQYGLLKDPRTGQNRTLYSLRHTYATFALTYKRGVDIHLLATQMGTSTLMIERHYSHLIARLRSATLAGGRW
jgi:integrase